MSDLMNSRPVVDKRKQRRETGLAIMTRLYGNGFRQFTLRSGLLGAIKSITYYHDTEASYDTIVANWRRPQLFIPEMPLREFIRDYGDQGFTLEIIYRCGLDVLRTRLSAEDAADLCDDEPESGPGGFNIGYYIPIEAFVIIDQLDQD